LAQASASPELVRWDIDAGNTRHISLAARLRRTLATHFLFRLARNYLDSKPVNSSVAFELRTSSICRDSAMAFAFKASIVELWGCNFSSSSIRLLNDASSN
jgi:hypothetical protein